MKDQKVHKAFNEPKETHDEKTIRVGPSTFHFQHQTEQVDEIAFEK